MSRHHWMYFGCQCSSARCSRLLLDRPTLFGIRSAEIMETPSLQRSAVRPRAPYRATGAGWPVTLRSVEVEFGPRLRSVSGERALLAHRVRTDENPVLPGGQ